MPFCLNTENQQVSCAKHRQNMAKIIQINGKNRNIGF